MKDQIIALWQKGLSFKEIGNELNISKNAVAGICWRNGLRRVARVVKIKRVKKMANSKEPNSEDGVSFMALESHHCRWTIGRRDEEFNLAMYCGATKVTGQSYCPYHFNKSRNKPSGSVRI